MAKSSIHFKAVDLQQKTGQIIKPDDLLIYLYSPAAGSSNYQCDFEKKSP